MRGAQTLALNVSRSIGANASDFFLDGPVVGAKDDSQRCAFSLRGSPEHMRQQRLAGQRMQDFWPGRAHARALAGSEHDGEAGSAAHFSPWHPAPTSRGRRHKAFRRQLKPDSAPAGCRIPDHGAFPVNVCCVIRLGLGRGGVWVPGVFRRKRRGPPQHPRPAPPAAAPPPPPPKNAPPAPPRAAPSPAPAVSPVATPPPAPAEKPGTDTTATQPGPAAAASVGQQTAPNPPAATPATPLVASKSIMAPPDAAASTPIEPEKPMNGVEKAPLPEVAASPPADDAGSDASEAAPAKVAVQRTEFGVDVGSANSLSGLRALWRGLL